MILHQSTINSLKKNYENLALLEAIDAFYQIRSFVTEDSQKQGCFLKDALLQLHQHILNLVQDNSQEDSLEELSLWKLINITEVVVDRIIQNIDKILVTTYRVKNILLGMEK